MDILDNNVPNSMVKVKEIPKYPYCDGVIAVQSSF